MSIKVISTPALGRGGCQWCPCTVEDEAAHPEWHGEGRCPRNCIAAATQEVTFIGTDSGAEFAMEVCDDHTISLKLLLVEKVTRVAFGGAAP